jgi:hypothetical protein
MISRRFAYKWIGLSFAALFIAACGSASDDRPAPTPEQDAATEQATGGSGGSAVDASPDGQAAGSAGATADAAADQEASSQPDGASADSSFPPGLKLKVTYQGASIDVDLNQPPLFQNGGYDYSLVSDIIAIAVPGKPVASLSAGFVAADGYNPADKPGCAPFVPVVGNQLKQGWVDRATRFLAWDPALAMPGCMELKDLAEILVTDQ